MNPKLAEALSLLGINSLELRDNEGKLTKVITPKEHAQALFTYLNLAGYLSEDLLSKAVKYLSASKPFAADNEVVCNALKQAYLNATPQGIFNANLFCESFASDDYFTVADIVDLLTFLQQTAFDRNFGQERDKLQVKPWMEEHANEFVELARSLGVIAPMPPSLPRYYGAGIMGASSPRVVTRLEYFNSLSIKYQHAYALSGNRELSKGLDDERLMEELVLASQGTANFVIKQVGAGTREFLDGITETMMVNYLIAKMCPMQEIDLVDSAIQQQHWRATAAQSAKDIAILIVEKIIKNGMSNEDYSFRIIAEQPFTTRMTKQIQRAFDAELKQRNCHFKITIEGCGPGLTPEQCAKPAVLTQLNSELGALMAERYNDASITLKNNSIALRDPAIIMFSKRDETFNALQKRNEEVVEYQHSPCV